MIGANIFRSDPGKHIMKKLLLVLALVASPLAAAAPALPDWLSGSWAMEDGASWAEEYWTSPRGGIMLGTGREGFGSEIKFWESMRITLNREGKLVLYAQPKGAPPTEFPMATMSDDAVEFTNPAHDYPQRIRYWRQGQLLMAESSKLDGSDAQRRNYRPVAPREP